MYTPLGEISALPRPSNRV